MPSNSTPARTTERFILDELRPQAELHLQKLVNFANF